jgi:hypothetical protein
MTIFFFKVFLCPTPPLPIPKSSRDNINNSDERGGNANQAQSHAGF